ncbi:MAG: cytochrome c biogenesis protein CcsA [Bacteroidota bacterium]
MLGLIGELALFVAFAAAIASGVAYVLASRDRLTPTEALQYKRLGRGGWLASLGATVGASVILWTLLLTEQYQYHYVYSQTSSAMPFRYQFSAFWAGQEGSFMLWILMTGAVGASVLWWSTRRAGITAASVKARETFEAPVMAVCALCLGFLLSMVIGLKIGGIQIGASPFITLAEKFPDAPIVQQAGYVPQDGQGLNDLLQNPWMTIHPPTLFVGFTMMMVPFAFAVAGLWKRQYTQWVKPALPWTLVGLGVLGLGIMMGGYWAYITLSFGGWWAWDPVENSSLVPWLIGVAALHAMLVQKKTSGGHKAALLLTVAAFAFVIYSTFLTRSGILGDVSVHSFVDLGLYNQLLLFILSIIGLGFGLFFYRYRDLPKPAAPPATLSRESFIFMGALTLALTGLVIILGTSAPIFGRIFRDNPAAVDVAFYNEWTLPLGIVMALLAGLGQLLWWTKMSVENVNRILLRPLALTAVSTAVAAPFIARGLATPQAPIADASVEGGAIEASLLGAGFAGFWDVYGVSLLVLLLAFAAFFAFWGNSLVLWRIGRGNLKLAGGSLTHVGFALVLMGILTSSFFNSPLTDGQGASVGGDRDNFIVEKGQTKAVEGYAFTYTGEGYNDEGKPVYILDVTTPSGRQFEARNVVYQDSRDQTIQSPHVDKTLMQDLYIAVYPSFMFGPTEEEQNGEIMLQRGETRSLGNREYSLRFVDYELDIDEAVVDIDPATVDLAVAARLELTNRATGETRTLRPVYVITNENEQQFIQNRVLDWGITVTFTGMEVNQGAIKLGVEGVSIQPEEWMVVQAYEKPFISILWLGTLILLAGFTLASVRRFGEQRSRKRDVKTEAA